MSKWWEPPKPKPEPAPEPDPANPRPQGEDVAWSALGTLLAGPITWGFIGWLIDRYTGTQRLFLALGVVLGFVTSLYIVYVRFGRD